MDQQPSEPEIQKLLEELKHKHPRRRAKAVQIIHEQKIADERLTEVLKLLTVKDPNNLVRSAACSALNSLGIVLPKRLPLSRNEKIRDFLIGFFGWWIVNVLLWVISPVDPSGQLPGEIFNFIVLPINIIVLIFLAFRRRWVALGVLATYAVNFIIALLLSSTVPAHAPVS